MNLKKTLLSAAVAGALTAAIAAPAQADVIDMSYSGLFTMLDPAGLVFQNKSMPYYYDPTWGYGLRTQISGTMSFDTATGAGSGTVTPFNFANGGQAVASGIEFQSIGNGLMLGNLNFDWNNGDTIVTQIVLDGSGLFAAIGAGVAVNDVYDQAWCGTTVGAPCALPASDGALPKGKYPIGPVPVATSSFNTAGQTGTTTTIGQLSLGTDDGIGGSPMDNGAFPSYNANFDMTSVTITAVTPAIPVPAAVWLFGSGLLGLVGVARRRKQV